MSALASTADPFTLAAAQLAPLSRLKAEPDWLRADFRTATRPLQIDRKNGIIYGRVLAEKGPFKSKGRGEFDDASLDLIQQLAADHPNGLKARFTHPGLSADGLGKFLGRDKNIRRDGDKVRGDLHLDKTALDVPPSGGKPLGVYCMDLAESDPAAFGSSLVLKAKKEYRQTDDGEPMRGDDGEELPPLWRPTKLHACDVVDEGDAVHNGFLSADLPDSVVRQVWNALDSQFSGCDAATIRSRGTAFLDRYLELKFEDDMNANPKPPAPEPTPSPAPNPQSPGRPTPPPAPPSPPPVPSPAGELAAWVAEQQAELQRTADAAKAELESERRAAAERARAEDVVACLSKARSLVEKGTVRAAATSEPSPAFVPLGEFLHLLDDSTPLGGGKLTLRAAFLSLLPTLQPPRYGERLAGGGSDPSKISAERRKELLGHTDAGRSVLKKAAG